MFAYKPRLSVLRYGAIWYSVKTALKIGLQMAYTIKKVNVSRIYLDNDNPRHDPIENEPEIISYLIKNEHVKRLARHIAEAGSTSPLERIGIVPHPKVRNAYIAAEGNRRLCAIKLLADPDKADTEANKRYFRNLATGMEALIDSFEAVIFDTHQEARRWVSLRHEGEQGGVGTLAWNSLQKTRFNAQEGGGSNPNIQASLLMEYARKSELLTNDEIDSLSITTITRYLTNPVFRSAMGLLDNKSLAITVPVDEFNRAIQKFLKDALEPGSGVNSRTSAAEREKYTNKLRKDGLLPTTLDQPPTELSGESKKTPAAQPEPKAESTKEPKRNNRSPDDRKTIIPADFTAHINDKTLKRLYDELRTLEAETYSFAATYLTRAVIERIATLLLKENGKPCPDELNKKLEHVAVFLADKGMTDRELKALRTMGSDRDSRYSPDTIGHFVHGGAIPTRVNAIKLWDSIEAVLKIALSMLK